MSGKFFQSVLWTLNKDRDEQSRAEQVDVYIFDAIHIIFQPLFITITSFNKPLIRVLLYGLV